MNVARLLHILSNWSQAATYIEQIIASIIAACSAISAFMPKIRKLAFLHKIIDFCAFNFRHAKLDVPTSTTTPSLSGN